MEQNQKNWKESIGIFIGIIVFIIIIFSIIYDWFFYKPTPKFLTPQERQEIERKLIDRYGSLENIPDDVNVRDCLDFGEGKGCW